MKDNSLLGYALLGLLHQQPLSGYDLRKIFASTPIGEFSDSPGAIYPALRRLQERGLVRGVVQASKGLRKRRVFRITPKGLASFKAWQSQPIVRDDMMIRRSGELLLRFAFMDQTFGPERALAFLREFARELSSYIPGLRQQLSHANEMPLSGRLALESGVQDYEARLRWARKSIAAYERRMKERL